MRKIRVRRLEWSDDSPQSVREFAARSANRAHRYVPSMGGK